MARGRRKCKICGKEYEYCKTERGDGVFRWQDVACCPEHAKEYFAQIAASRGEVTADSASDDVITSPAAVADVAETIDDTAAISLPHIEDVMEDTRDDADE